MSSLEYAELAGLNLIMDRLKRTPVEQQTDTYLAVYKYIDGRIQELRGK